MTPAAHAQLVNALCQDIRAGLPAATLARLQAVERANRPSAGGSRSL